MIRNVVYFNDVPVGNICCRLENKELYLTTLGILAVSRHFSLDGPDALIGSALQSLIDPGSWALKPCSASSRQHLPITSPKSSAYPSTYRSPMVMPGGSMRAMASAKLAFTKITTKRSYPKMRGYWRKSSNTDQNNSYALNKLYYTSQHKTSVCDGPRVWKNTYVHNIQYVYKGEHSSHPSLRGLGDQDEINTILMK